MITMYIFFYQHKRYLFIQIDIVHMPKTVEHICLYDYSYYYIQTTEILMFSDLQG